MKLHGAIFEIEAKAISESGEFVGYASVFGKEDLGADVVMPGAFANSLQKRGAGGIKMLRQHDSRDPIGIWTSLKEDSRGLQAEGKLILSTTRGKETHELLKAGALDGLSIGFRTVKDRYDAKKRVRFLEEIDLREISIVTFPMAEDATVAAVKSDKASRSLLRAINELNARIKI